jgi:hypothetical protein
MTSAEYAQLRKTVSWFCVAADALSRAILMQKVDDPHLRSAFSRASRAARLQLVDETRDRCRAAIYFGLKPCSPSPSSATPRRHHENE